MKMTGEIIPLIKLAVDVREIKKKGATEKTSFKNTLTPLFAPV